LAALKPLEERILLEIRNHQMKCMSFHEIVEKLLSPDLNPNPNPGAIVDLTCALNNLVERRLLRQFRAVRSGIVENHYKAI